MKIRIPKMWVAEALFTVGVGSTTWAAWLVCPAAGITAAGLWALFGGTVIALNVKRRTGG